MAAVVLLASEAKEYFSMFLGGTRYRQGTVNNIRGTGILGPYLATSVSPSSYRL